MTRIWVVGILALAACEMSTAAMAGNLAGRITFTGYDNKGSEPDSADSVVFFKPDALVAVVPLKGDITMTMAGKSFIPHVLAVPVGTQVRFPNADPIFHNAFSPSSPNEFDLGVYDNGPGKSQSFSHPGLIHVYCNVHRDMFAYILVLDTPYFLKAKDDGSFDLEGLPAGSGELTVWNPRTAIWRQRITVGGAEAPLSVQLNVIYGGVPEHLNKDGKPYFHHHTPGA